MNITEIIESLEQREVTVYNHHYLGERFPRVRETTACTNTAGLYEIIQHLKQCAYETTQLEYEVLRLKTKLKALGTLAAEA